MKGCIQDPCEESCVASVSCKMFFWRDYTLFRLKMFQSLLHFNSSTGTLKHFFVVVGVNTGTAYVMIFNSGQWLLGSDQKVVSVQIWMSFEDDIEREEGFENWKYVFLKSEVSVFSKKSFLNHHWDWIVLHTISSVFAQTPTLVGTIEW